MPISFKKLSKKRKTTDADGHKKIVEKAPKELPGVFNLTKRTSSVLWKNHTIFLVLAIIYVLAVVLVINVISESSYSSIKAAININLGTIGGVFGNIVSAGLVSISALGGGLSSSSTSSDKSLQLISFIIMLFTWLSVIWALRNILAGRKFKIRDILYNCGAPIIPTLIIGLIFLLELIPIALGVIIVSAAVETGFMAQIVGLIIVVAVFLLLFGISIYWIIGTLFGLVVATLPGMYPIAAIRSGNKLVSGRRASLIGRLLWAVLLVVAAWLVILIPLILFDGWVKGAWTAISWLPFIPIVVAILSAVTIIWVFSYIYIIYREMIDREDTVEA